MATIQIDYPEELLEPTDQTAASLARLAREALLVRLYDLGKLSSGKAAELLGISRREFLDLLGTSQAATTLCAKLARSRCRRSINAMAKVTPASPLIALLFSANAETNKEHPCPHLSNRSPS